MKYFRRTEIQAVTEEAVDVTIGLVTEVYSDDLQVNKTHQIWWEDVEGNEVGEVTGEALEEAYWKFYDAK